MAPVPVHLRPVLTPQGVADLMGVHTNTVYAWIKHEGLPTFTITRGGNYLIRRESLDRWLKEREARNAA